MSKKIVSYVVRNDVDGSYAMVCVDCYEDRDVSRFTAINRVYAKDDELLACCPECDQVIPLEPGWTDLELLWQDLLLAVKDGCAGGSEEWNLFQYYQKELAWFISQDTDLVIEELLELI